MGTWRAKETTSDRRGGIRRRRRRAGAAGVALAVIAALGVGVPAPAASAATDGPWTPPPAPVRVSVDSGAVASMSIDPLPLAPAFSRDIHDYVVRCAAGSNQLTLTLGAVPGETLRVGGETGQSVSLSEKLLEDQALVVTSTDAMGAPREDWVRCLPHDFPDVTPTSAGTATPGWYVTGTVSAARGKGYFATVLDTNGTPVWYERSDAGVVDVTPLEAGQLAWFDAASGSFDVHQLDGSIVDQIATSGVPTDLHELLALPGGDRMLLSYPDLDGVDLTALGLGTDQRIADCVAQEVDPAGDVVWQWRASDHIAPSESEHPQLADGRYDVYHCNSIDSDGAGNLLLSFRHTDAVYLVDQTSGAVRWKLGGNDRLASGAEHLAITGDPQTGISGQHDARFQADGVVSLFDDQTWLPGPARGVQYRIDADAATATWVSHVTNPDGARSRAMGGYRPAADGHSVVDWGSNGARGFTEFDADGGVALDVGFGGSALYRTVKVPLDTYDLATLRATSGSSAPTETHACTDDAMTPGRGAVVAIVAAPRRSTCAGYWAATSEGTVGAFGSATHLDDAAGVALTAPVIDMAATSTGNGYWLVAGDGGIFTYGDAAFFGSTGAMTLNQPIVGMASTPTGKGYWLVAKDGGIFAFGDAAFFGSTGAITLNEPIVGMASTPTGKGYWLVAKDGGIFAFGDAAFFGSTGAITLNEPIVGMASTPTGKGYWLVAKDGGIFAFGAAGFYGSTGAITLNEPIVRMASTPTGRGYWMVARDGGVFGFGDAGYRGRIEV